jgi:hypothetical protein
MSALRRESQKEEISSVRSTPSASPVAKRKLFTDSAKMSNTNEQTVDSSPKVPLRSPTQSSKVDKLPSIRSGSSKLLEEEITDTDHEKVQAEE